MKIRDYVSAAKTTAEEEAYRLAYLVPAILGEVGEIYGQIAKNTWHGWDRERYETELVSEYGDVCWIAAILTDRWYGGAVPEISVLGQEDFPTEFEPYEGAGAVSFAVAVVIAAIEAHSQADPSDSEEFDEADDAVSTALTQLWGTLVAMAEATTGHPIEVAFEANLAKLKDRKARGVLRGAGDHR